MNSKRFRVRVDGEFACFTRPETPVHRMSYEVITPPAAIGLISSILWKPAIQWQVHKVEVLNEIKWMNVFRNEVKSTMVPFRTTPYYTNDDRTQRNSVILKDVSYVLEISFRMTDKAGERDGVIKFEQMFEKRMRKGKYFRSPYLGCREFPAQVEFATGDEKPLPINMDLGLMTYGVFHGDIIRPSFFPASLVNGVLTVPNVIF